MTIEEFEKRISLVSEPFIKKIEAKYPGSSRGIGKDEHMKRMALNASRVIKEGIVPKEKELVLYAALRTHDIGRFVEQLKEENIRHGLLGVKFLRENKVLEGFNIEDRAVIEWAVHWHSEPFVPKTPSLAPDFMKLAERICLVVRDLDKEEIFVVKDYFLPKSIFSYYLLPISSKEMQKVMVRPDIEGKIIGFLSGSSELAGVPQEIKSRIASVMNAPISADVLGLFLKKQPIVIDLAKDSFKDYVVLQLAMIFDINFDFILENIASHKEQSLVPRMNAVAKDTPKRIVDDIRGLLNGHFADRLGIGDIF